MVLVLFCRTQTLCNCLCKSQREDKNPDYRSLRHLLWNEESWHQLYSLSPMGKNSIEEHVFERTCFWKDTLNMKSFSMSEKLDWRWRNALRMKWCSDDKLLCRYPLRFFHHQHNLFPENESFCYQDKKFHPLRRPPQLAAAYAAGTRLEEKR